jgi:chloramphenicol 3-O-phosphotransferase
MQIQIFQDLGAERFMYLQTDYWFVWLNPSLCARGDARTKGGQRSGKKTVK